MIAHLEQGNARSTTSDGIAVTTFILKIASRCNLNCTYCYVYNKGDTSYLRHPQRMSTEVAVATLGRIRQHCIRHSLPRVELIFHGGEPLLAGKDFFRQFTTEAVRMLSPD